MKNATTLALLLALASVPAWAADEGSRPINERRPLKADARVSVSNVAGLIDVEVWDKNELLLTGSLGADVEELKISGSEASLTIEVKLPKVVNNPDETLLKLKVPAGASLEAEGVSADIRVRGLRGAVKVDSVSGDVRLDVASRKVSAGTVSGDVSVQAPAESTRAASVSGDVTVRGVRGELEIESVSGTLRAQAREVRVLDAETVSGDIELDLELARGAEIEAETLSGEVMLTLPQMPEGQLRLETFSGEIRSPWWKQDEDDDDEYRHDGKGPGRVKLNSFSGDIELKKK